MVGLYDDYPVLNSIINSIDYGYEPTDHEFLDFLSYKAITPKVFNNSGSMYDANKKVVAYPYLHPIYQDDVTAIKYRNILTGEHYYQSGGRILMPFIAQHGKPGCRLVVCEGETDSLAVASMMRNDYVTVIGIPGSSMFKNHWHKFISSFNEVIIIPDNDDAGQKMVENVSKHCDWALRFNIPEEYKDVSEYISETLIDQEDFAEIMRRSLTGA